MLIECAEEASYYKMDTLTTCSLWIYNLLNTLWTFKENRLTFIYLFFLFFAAFFWLHFNTPRCSILYYTTKSEWENVHTHTQTLKDKTMAVLTCFLPVRASWGSCMFAGWFLWKSVLLWICVVSLSTCLRGLKLKTSK